MQEFGKGFEAVYRLVSQIPNGKVTTYGAIAKRLHTSPRVVGFALNKNPYPKTQVPCHRIMGKDGSLVGYAGGLARKREMLEQEGIEIIDGRVNLNKNLWNGFTS